MGFFSGGSEGRGVGGTDACFDCDCKAVAFSSRPGVEAMTGRAGTGVPMGRMMPGVRAGEGGSGKDWVGVLAICSAAAGFGWSGDVAGVDISGSATVGVSDRMVESAALSGMDGACCGSAAGDFTLLLVGRFGRTGGCAFGAFLVAGCMVRVGFSDFVCAGCGVSGVALVGSGAGWAVSCSPGADAVDDSSLVV